MQSTPHPSDCKCRSKPLPQLIAEWRSRSMQRILDAVNSTGVDMRSVRAEAHLLRDLADGKNTPFEGRNPERGHLCDECPFRRRTPLKRSLAVDPRTSAG